jgi:hypothetical protein
LQAEIRRRLWATIVELNTQYSVESGTRPLISVDDFDTEAPANINDDDIDENTNLSLVSKPSHVFTQTSVQIILLESLKMRIEILQVCNRLSTEPSYQEVSRLGEIMTKECRASSFLIRKLQSSKSDLRPTQLQVWLFKPQCTNHANYKIVQYSGHVSQTLHSYPPFHLRNKITR